MRDVCRSSLFSLVCCEWLFFRSRHLWRDTDFLSKPAVVVFQARDSLANKAAMYFLSLKFFCFFCLYDLDCFFLCRVPTRHWNYWESIELWNWFSRPWKSIEFGWNVHKVMKKYGNYKFSYLFIQILFFTADDSFAGIFSIVFNE